MIKITQIFYQAKTKKTVSRLLFVFALLLMGTQVNAQTSIKSTVAFKTYSTGTDGFSGYFTTYPYMATTGVTANVTRSYSLPTTPLVDLSPLTSNVKWFHIKVGSAKTLTFTNVVNVDKIYIYGHGSSSNRTVTATVKKNGGAALTGSVVNTFANSSTAISEYVFNISGFTGYSSSDAYDVSITTNGDILVYGIALTPSATTWDGVAWLKGVPSATVDAVVDGAYNTIGGGAQVSFTAKKLTVTSSGSLTIATGTNVTVQNEVINNGGALIVENNANLVQVNSASVNTGNVVVKRNSSALSRLDYTLWSSPVASQNLVAFSPLTSQSPNRFYTYNTTYNTGGVSGAYTETADPTLTNFTPGAGYLIRMPNTALAAPATQTFNGQFTGVPNNGDIPFTLVDGGVGLRYNLVGNPYPSPITISTFLADNANITGTLYFWRKTNGTGTAYCTVTGGVFASNGNAQSFDPAGVIQTGQGFIVEANGSGTALVFKNTQRVANTTGQFFKTKQVAVADRVWLNATNTAGDFSQTAVNYTADATSGVDAFDGKYINDSAFALTSNVNNEEYVIQGRPAFDSSDIVPLNFKTAVAGDYTIAIDRTEGVFAAGQDVYLVDSTTGIETNLKSGSYTFTAPTGASNSRFALKYQKTLGVNDVAFNENNVAVYNNKGVVYINSGAAVIADIKIYDVQGKLLAELKEVKSTSASIGLKAVNQLLVVKVTAEDGAVVTKKVVN